MKSNRGRPLPVLIIKQIAELWNDGKGESVSAIASTLKLSRNTVRKYLRSAKFFTR